MLRTDAQRLDDENKLLRASNATLSSQLQELQQYQKELDRCKCGTYEAELRIYRDEAIISGLRLDESHRDCRLLQAKLDALSDASRLAQIEYTKILSERDSLLDALNTVRSRFASTSPSFRASDPNFSTLCRRFFANLSGNFIPPWQAPNSRLIACEVELEELRSANIEYAKDLRELQRQLLRK